MTDQYPVPGQPDGAWEGDAWTGPPRDVAAPTPAEAHAADFDPTTPAPTAAALADPTAAAADPAVVRPQAWRSIGTPRESRT